LLSCLVKLRFIKNRLLWRYRRERALFARRQALEAAAGRKPAMGRGGVTCATIPSPIGRRRRGRASKDARLSTGHGDANPQKTKTPNDRLRPKLAPMGQARPGRFGPVSRRHNMRNFCCQQQNAMRADESFSEIGIHAIVFPSAGFGAVSAREPPGDEEKEECIWADRSPHDVANTT
jgi:hypothetical protein